MSLRKYSEVLGVNINTMRNNPDEEASVGIQTEIMRKQRRHGINTSETSESDQTPSPFE